MKTISVSDAKSQLGKILDRAAKGERILISRKTKLFYLQEFTVIEPIPLAPIGTFTGVDSNTEIKLENRMLAKNFQGRDE